MTDNRSPLDAALDLVLYAPVGLALTIGEELPKLAAKGRAGLSTRVSTARVVGQFAVAQGRREVDRRLRTPAPASPPASAPGPGSGTSGPRPAAGGPAPAAGGPASAASGPGAGAASAASASSVVGSNGAAPVTPLTRPPTSRAGAGVAPGPAVASLAIPGYDSLSASQVVQRLAGLSGSELEAVKAYEAANRGRRTILARIGQLQGS